MNDQIRELAREATQAARDAGCGVTGSYAFKSFVRGQWQVIASLRPHLLTHRVEFLEAAGAR